MGACRTQVREGVEVDGDVAVAVLCRVAVARRSTIDKAPSWWSHWGDHLQSLLAGVEHDPTCDSGSVLRVGSGPVDGLWCTEDRRASFLDPARQARIFVSLPGPGPGSLATGGQLCFGGSFSQAVRLSLACRTAHDTGREGLHRGASAQQGCGILQEEGRRDEQRPYILVRDRSGEGAHQKHACKDRS